MSERRLSESTTTPAGGRRMGIEEAVAVQIDRINDLRTNGWQWEKAVLALRSMCIGLEDETFKEAWKKRPCRSLASKKHKGVFYDVPTDDDLERWLEIVLELLARHQITWRHRTLSRTGRVEMPRPLGSA